MASGFLENTIMLMVYITKNGRYVLIGSPNTTLLDANGTVLWQLSSRRVTTPTGLGDPNSVNTVHLSEDAKLIVLGYNNGTFQFWRFVKAKPVEYTPVFYSQTCRPYCHSPLHS